MPPSWSSRLLSGSGSTTPNDLTPSPLQRPNPPLSNPPTSNGLPTLRSPSSPVRSNSAANRQHHHNRSASHPLPRIFARKKSTNNLVSTTDLDSAVDEALVPVLDEDHLAPYSKKSGYGKRNLDDEPSTTRHCMCCYSKVRFPRGLKVFRCTNCFTVNDLEPYRPRAREGDGMPEDESQSSKQPTLLLGPKPALPLSLRTTRAIIDQCLLDYLQARCARQSSDIDGLNKDATTSPLKPEAIAVDKPNVENSAPQKSIGPDTPSTELSPSPLSRPASPIEAASATIRDYSDFDQFPFLGNASDSPGPSNPPPGDVTTVSPQIQRKPVPTRPLRKPPPIPLQSTSPALRPKFQRHVTPPTAPSHTLADSHHGQSEADYERYERVKKIFRPLEAHIHDSYGSFECLNASFSDIKRRQSARTYSESAIATPPPERMDSAAPDLADFLPQIDAKTLLLGDVAENGDWWTGRSERNYSERTEKRKGRGSVKQRLVTSKDSMINWPELNSWYDAVHCAGQQWRGRLDDVVGPKDCLEKNLMGPKNAQEIDSDMLEAREHAQRALLKITEHLLKRPGRPLNEPEDIRFLIIILSNPSLYPQIVRNRSQGRVERARHGHAASSNRLAPAIIAAGRSVQSPPRSPSVTNRDPGQHTGILKRIFGLLANSSDSCHRYMVGWFSRLPEFRFRQIVDLVASFVTYRLSKRKARPRSQVVSPDGGLIPELSGSARNTSFQLQSQLQATTGLIGGNKKSDDGMQSVADYSEDWQLRAAAKLMAILFAANNSWQSNPNATLQAPPPEYSPSKPRPRAKTHGQLLTTSDFYNTLLDYHDLIADFKAWESKKTKFAFCQFPFFLSMGSKIKILEYDARRQMENKAREAYFDQVNSRRNIDLYFHLRVRRDCMVDDSLRQISEAVGAGEEGLKKGLRVHFTGEEGVDAGGLRKEWFLIIVRDIFDPNHGMFLYDDDSRTCYFNPHSFETSNQYYLVGALLGLAIYNSTILDVALPPFAFRKLLAAGPSSSNASLTSTTTRGAMTYTIDDLAEYRPALAAGLRKLLEFEGDVEATFCRDFVAPVERYGTVTNVPLCPGGDNRAVTNENRTEFVDMYIRYLLDGSVARQFEPFTRGFFTVCAGNALSLFRAEEIELLVRGSDEALDVDSLKAVAVYENWRTTSTPPALVPNPAETIPVIAWFWDSFRKANPSDQRKLLSFITSSDRIPAVGATSLVLKIVAGGDGTGKEEATAGAIERFPIARTCFNMLVLWRYDSRVKMEEKLWRAVYESEGFGLR